MVSSSFASSSVLAVVQITMSMPRICVYLVVLDLGEDQLLLDAESSSCLCRRRSWG